jgi:type VI secretion system secreted protein VgrG
MEPDEIKKIQIFGLEYYGKYYGVYAGTVTSNKDPQSQGRVKVQVPALGRDDALAAWAYPVSPFAGDKIGFFFPPEEGSVVWLMFEGGNPSLPLYLGGWWKNPTKTAVGGMVPTDAKPNGQSPTVREIRTRSGHRIIFDEGADPGITIQTAKGNIIRMKDNSKSIEVISSGEIIAKAGTIKVQATSAEVSASSVKVSASTADVQANYMNLAASLMRLNNGSSPVARVGDGTQAGGSITTGNPTILG